MCLEKIQLKIMQHLAQLQKPEEIFSGLPRNHQQFPSGPGEKHFVETLLYGTRFGRDIACTL